jgi:hypothetical protein
MLAKCAKIRLPVASRDLVRMMKTNDIGKKGAVVA